MKEFIRKWSNWWILNPKRKQLDDAFEKELNKLIEQEVAFRQCNIYGFKFLGMNETMKLKCKKCECDYEKPSVFKEYLAANNNNVFYIWSLTFCDRCRKEKERESLKLLPDVMKALVGLPVRFREDKY